MSAATMNKTWRRRLACSTVRSVKSRSADAMQMPAPTMGLLPMLSDGTKTCNVKWVFLGAPAFIPSVLPVAALCTAGSSGIAAPQAAWVACLVVAGQGKRAAELALKEAKRQGEELDGVLQIGSGLVRSKVSHEGGRLSGAGSTASFSCACSCWRWRPRHYRKGPCTTGKLANTLFLSPVKLHAGTSCFHFITWVMVCMSINIAMAGDMQELQGRDVPAAKATCAATVAWGRLKWKVFLPAAAHVCLSSCPEATAV